VSISTLDTKITSLFKTCLKYKAERLVSKVDLNDMTTTALTDRCVYKNTMIRNVAYFFDT